MITLEDFHQWKTLPVTQNLFKVLKDLEDDLKDSWASGLYTSEEAVGTVQLNAEALGKLSAIRSIKELDFYDLRDI